MKIANILIWVVIFLVMGNSCRAEVKPSSEIVMEVADLQCDEVWEGVLRILKNNKIPLLMVDKKEEYIETGPLITLPLKGDSFQKMEEQYRIKIKCIEPLVTQITCQIKVRGFTKDNNWVVVKDVLKYERRFLDSLQFNK